MRHQGVLQDAWADFSYDLALQATATKQLEEDELMFCLSWELYSAALSGWINFFFFFDILHESCESWNKRLQ